MSTWDPWDPEAAGVLRLPSGRLIRGRGLRQRIPDGPAPEFAVYLLGSSPPPVAWEHRWLRWPDFWLPADQSDALNTLQEAWRRSGYERVEIACWGGHGRTGTALAIIAVMDGVPPGQAVSFVREHYGRRAVETPWQRWYVRRISGRIS
jgi:protein-tyrosine phosphatase